MNPATHMHDMHRFIPAAETEVGQLGMNYWSRKTNFITQQRIDEITP